MGLTSRLLIFNLLLAIFPVGATLFLGTYEKQLLDSQERAMVQQGRILAAALKGTDLARESNAILNRLGARTEARLRVVDSKGLLLADSARPLLSKDVIEETSHALVEQENHIDDEELQDSYPEESLIYHIGALPARAIRRIFGFIGPPKAPQSDAEYYIGKQVLDGPEIWAALNGRYGAATRISQGQVSVTLYSAIPIMRNNALIGAVLVSRSTFAILNNLYRLRLDIMIIFLFGVGAAVLLSLLLARTVTVPVGRLRDQAECLLDERGKLLASFRPLSGGDEVADLSRALHHLSNRLQERTDHLEDFMADLVHEMKNPVAGILSSVELSEEADNGETQRFLELIGREGRRIQRQLDGLRELLTVDFRLDRNQAEQIDLNQFLLAFVQSFSFNSHRGIVVAYVDQVAQPVFVHLDPDRLSQAILNLVDNAVSFSPDGGKVELRIVSEAKTVGISVSDQGPGVPEEDRERIFERWYTDRPENDADDHTGLGLAIVNGIALGYGGTVYARQTSEGGSVFTIEFPRDNV